MRKHLVAATVLSSEDSHVIQCQLKVHQQVPSETPPHPAADSVVRLYLHCHLFAVQLISLVQADAVPSTLELVWD